MATEAIDIPGLKSAIGSERRRGIRGFVPRASLTQGQCTYHDAFALTEALMPLARRWRQAFDDRLATVGLSAAVGWPLLIVARQGDDIRQVDLAAGLHMNAGALVRLIDALVDQGYVERVLDPADRRVRRVRLLERGREAAAQAGRVVATLHQEALGELDAREVATAVRVAHLVVGSLDAAVGP